MNAQPSDAAHVHTSRLRIRWGDMDAMGHVNNARFFTFFEQTRIDWLESFSKDDALRNNRQGFILAHASCDFKVPVVYPAVLEIRLLCEPPGRTSFTSRYEVYDEDGEVLHAVGKGVMVWIDLETGEPTPLPGRLRAVLEDRLLT